MSFKSFNNVIDASTTGGWAGYGDEFLKILYDKVIETKPNTIIEFGTGYGYTTIALAQGLRDLDNPNAVLYTYDHYEDDHYTPLPTMKPWSHTQDIVKTNLEKFNVQDYVKMYSLNILQWFDAPFNFDMAFIDVHNNGIILNQIFNQKFFKDSVENGAEVLFCGGSIVRDQINIQRHEVPITSVDCNIECIYGGATLANPGGGKGCISRILGYEK